MKFKCLIRKICNILIFVLLTVNISAQNLGFEKAKLSAENFLISKGINLENINLEGIYKSNGTVLNPLYCFQNYDGGFALVSENKGEFIVVGYSLTASINTNNRLDAFNSLISFYETTEKLSLEINNNLKSNTRSYVAPLLDAQGISLNQFYHQNVGDCPSGCVATAMAQIMAYYKYPANGVGSYCYNHSTYGELCVDFETANYNWINPDNDDYEILSYHIGVAMNMNYCGHNQYGIIGSIPSISNYHDILKTYFKYYLHRGSSENFYLKSELDNNRPIYCELLGDPSHAVVIDGYDEDDYFHINFGWGGNHNGYFILNSNSTFEAGSYTFGTNISSCRFISPTPFPVNPNDSLALLAFHNSMNETTGWDISQPVIYWNGVVVMNDRVISLSLNSVLQGQIPDEISDLSALQNFNIKGFINGLLPNSIINLSELKGLTINYYDGSNIPSLPVNIGNLTNLESLSMKAVGNIPQSIANLSNLKVLNLSGGDMTGTIPVGLYDLLELEEIDLSDNQFADSISYKIGQLTKLQKLILYKNQFLGQLPNEIGNLTLLKEFHVFENQFQGIIPESVGNWTNLESFYINDNAFEGMLPNSICQHTHFNVLNISNNQFSSLPDSIGNLINLQQILASNNLIETVPASIANLTALFRLDLSYNKITTIPGLGEMPALWDLILSNNNINSLSESFTDLSRVSDLYLGNNELEELPSSFENLTTLKHLAISSNKLKSIPFSFSFLSNLEVLYLPNNQISGPLPPLNHLENLIDLNIKNNKLTFNDIAYSLMPDDTIFTDSYEFNYYDQDTIELSDTLYLFEKGDTLSIDVRQISNLCHENNTYKWYKNDAFFIDGPVLTINGFDEEYEGEYSCKVKNTKYTKLLELQTEAILLADKNDSIYLDAYYTSTVANTGNVFTDRQITLLTPELRGIVKWQASLDSINWYNISDTMSNEQIWENISSVTDREVVVEPKDALIFRFIVEEGTCNPLISDSVRILPYADLLLDTLINVQNEPITIAVDSIEIVIPAGFTYNNFRLTIEKLLNPPIAPDTTVLASVYDVNISTGSIFDVPLLIKLKNFNADEFNQLNIDNYKPVYYDDKNQKWVEFTNGGLTLNEDGAIEFYTNHLTKLSWWDISHGSYTHIHTRDRVNVIYKSGVGGEDNFYQVYENDILSHPAETWHNSNSDPDNGGTPYMIQDIGEYMDQIINKFEALGLETPSLRFNVYVGLRNTGAGGEIGAAGYLSGRGYFYIDPIYNLDKDDLRRTLAHEYMHYTQDYYMTVLLDNYFWMEATAPLADRMVWNETELSVPEPEVHFNDAMLSSKDSKSIFDLIAISWDALSSSIPVYEKFKVNSAEANVSSTFLHYMRSYREGEKLKPEVLIRETPYTGSWLNYLDTFINEKLSSTIGDEFEGFVKYIFEGTNLNFSLINHQEGEDPFKYFRNNDFVTTKLFKFKQNESLIEDTVSQEVPYIAAKLVQLYNGNQERLIVQYKRLSEQNDNMKVYLCNYDSDNKKMLFEDITDVDSSMFIIGESGVDKMEKKHVAFLLFINKSKTESINVDYLVKMYHIPDFLFFDDFVFTKGYGMINAEIHKISDGINEFLDVIHLIPQVYRTYADEFYSTMYYNQEITEELIITNAWSDWMEQTVTYNYITGEMTIYEKENWGGLTPTSSIDMREMTMTLQNVWLIPYVGSGVDASYYFKTNTTEETQNVIVSLEYTREYAMWNQYLDPPAHDPTINYTYIETEYPANPNEFTHIKLHLSFW
ncbi:MAG: C10 family peptidase [Bacteroidales bacterium]|nr:C10 family peptidase [Bacteroidales bacterium]